MVGLVPFHKKQLLMFCKFALMDLHVMDLHESVHRSMDCHIYGAVVYGKYLSVKDVL
jgi:hypothetical protein